MTELSDENSRRRIRQDLQDTFVVEAAAGTGKTTALVGRIVAVVQAGLATLDRMVAVTFTEKAAGEMKLRLRTELETARETARVDAERAHLGAALAALEVTHINTIHGFCAELLRERPIEASLDPAFRILDEFEADQLVADAFETWFETALSDPPEGLRRVLRRRSWRAEGMTPRELLLQACRSLVEHRDFTCAWQAPQFDRTTRTDEIIQRFRALGLLRGRAHSSDDPLASALNVFRDWVDNVDRAERLRQRDYDGIEAELMGFERKQERAFKQKGSGRLFGPSLDRNAILAQRDDARQALKTFAEMADADLSARLRIELTPILSTYEALKRKHGVVDFLDLLLHTRDLLKHDAPMRAHLQARFTHLFVDEFQDTDPLQAEILMLLAADNSATTDFRRARVCPGKLFVVGDPKQSIYRFRRADVAFYEQTKRELMEQGAELLHLTTNFRTVPVIQRAVNSAFSQRMTGAADGSQAEYVPLGEHRENLVGQPGLVALPIPEPYGRSRLAKKAVEASYPDAVAAFVKWLLDTSGWRVSEGQQLVPVSSRHVCLLFRRFRSFDGDITHRYVRALEARRIPHVLIGGRSFHDREEVMAIRTALEAVEWPDDELSVYATLHGPLFSITDEDLLCFRNDFRRLHPLRPFDISARERHPAVVDALEILRGLHVARNRRPVADTVEQLLSATRAHAAFAMWPTGEQTLANALSIVDFAHSLESRGVTSFRMFLEVLAEQAEHSQGSEAPIIEEGTEGVRVMTVHKAKGLEFPIVIVCDPTAPLESTRGTRYVDVERRLWAEPLCGCRPLDLLDNLALARRHDEAEYVRLAYVAATRARDLLVVPVFGDASAIRPGVGWMDTMASAVYPLSHERRNPRPAPGCPSFADDSVLMRPADAEAMPDGSVAPGLHNGGAGSIDVVWWDPAQLELHVEPLGGVRQQELLAEPVDGSDGGTRAYAEWQARRQVALMNGTVPTLSKARITDLARDPLGTIPTDSIVVERTDVDRSARPRGPRFGTLVHALLAAVPLDSERSSLERLVHCRASLLGSTPEEERAAIDAVIAALAHPLVKRARSSNDIRREVPVSHVQNNGTLAEGVVDLTFREAGGWTIVDFKTDALEPTDHVYATQLALYVAAIREATQEPACGVLFMV